MNEFNMPIDNEDQQNNRDNKGGPQSPLSYRPLPFDAGSVGNNEVIIPLFTPHTWKMFNPTEEEAQRYGMVNSGLVSFGSNPLATFYFKLPVHRVQNFSGAGGNQKFANVLCPVEMNKYLVESMERGPMFEHPRCAFCEEVGRQWDIENARWDEIEASEGINKKKLSKEGYWDRIDHDPVLSKARKVIKQLKVWDRYAVGVFDHAKFTGRRPLDEGETSACHQVFLAPKSVREKLVNLFRADLLFFKPAPDGSWPVLTLVKDTSACSSGNLMMTKYDVLFVNKYHKYDESWSAYLSNCDAMADPSYLIQMATHEEGVFHVAQNQESRYNYNAQPNDAPATPPVTTNPVAAPPVAAPPVAAPPVAASPVVPPQPAPVAAPIAAPPAGAPPAFTPPVAAPPVPETPAAAPAGPPIPSQPPVPEPVRTTTPGGPIPVVSPGGAPPAGPAPTGAPPAGVPAGAPPGAPPMAQPAGSPPDRTPPAGEDPPGRRRNW
jgi:hypothetical protein